ncbi:ribonuclease H family protein [Alloscardovia criceti]|uniref:ribonuclease H family protein n=1 Tax=Alloscardovia criceti TaxID=356828 RepID=UPI00037DED39|nr:ribonuclease H [Alloscardovia criceti]
MDIDFTVTVSTDGSALNNPNGPMGWGWAEHTDKNPGGVITSITGHAEDCGGASNGTNQIGELAAVLQCLRAHPGAYPLIIETDSQYAIKCSTIWLVGWKKNGWKNSQKKSVKNVELIRAIDAELTAREGSVKFEWVKGHAGNFYNEKVDDLARGFAEKAGKKLVEGYMPDEGWQVLLNGAFADLVELPSDYGTQSKSSDSASAPAPASASQALFDAEDFVSSSTQQTPSAPAQTNAEAAEAQTDAVEETASSPAPTPVSKPQFFDQALFEEDNTTLSEELISRLNQATERFDLAAQRLQLASEHMDQAVAKLDEAIRRFDDVSWKNNHQDTLF